MQNLSGQNLGRYQIIESLGQGGMASVYKAFDTSLERYLAIKVIRTDIGGEESQFLARFQREAKALAKLDHPYILKVLDYGEQNGIPYLVMPFVQGGTLKEKMGHPMPYAQAAALLAPIADALEYAHQRGIIHRDVKPANILLTETGVPLLSDFGIAKILSAQESTQLTGTGVGIGTPDYMAPEQWLGNADPRTDIYSLGIVFFEMVTGYRPFSADTPAAVLLKHLNDPLPRPRSFVTDLPEEVEQVLFKALAKDMENRFQSMGSFAEALGKLAHGERLNMSAESLATLQSVPAASSRTQISPPETRIAARPVKSKTNTNKIGIMALVGVLGIGLICVLAVGTFLLSRYASAQKNRTATIQASITNSNGDPITGMPEATDLPISTQTVQFDSSLNDGTPFVSIDGFPDDIPFLKDNNGDLATTTSEGMQMFSFTSNQSFDQLSEFYKNGMLSYGWDLTSESTQSGQVMWYYSKGESRIVMISVSTEDNINFISIIIVNQ